MKVGNWGNYPVTDAIVQDLRGGSGLHQQLQELQGGIARGLGRCYGDSALAPRILSTTRHNRFLDFDTERGILTCEGGLSFAEILPIIVAKGWFLPVTPGTKFVTVGGAIASDVHGKNHHKEGSFSAHVVRLRLLVADGQVLECSPTEQAEVFAATCGGMGLTGIILQATFRLKRIQSAYIREESTKLGHVDDLFRAFEGAQAFTYSVAWVDCLSKGKHLGRSILLNGEHATLEDLRTHRMASTPFELPKKMKLSVPFMLPSFTLNPLTIRLFNSLYYAKAPRGSSVHITDYESYFYPLDGVMHWNRVYGKKGFVQYQFVIPPQNGHEGMVKILEAISSARMPSFLTVLKYMGPQEGMISFPMEGYTLALDFPVTERIFSFLDGLDQVVRDFGGRLYLTKDSRMSADMFRSGYPDWQKFQQIRRSLDPHGVFASLQSRRLGLENDLSR